MTHPFYRSAEWRDARAQALARQPWCEVPGCGQRSTNVDHRTAIARGGHRTDPRNLQCLCGPHHSSKTAQVDGGFGNRRRDGTATLRVLGADADGTPRDPNHPWNRKRG